MLRWSRRWRRIGLEDARLLAGRNDRRNTARSHRASTRLALTAGYAWAHIVLPYYREPYYQVSKTAFIRAAINFVPDDDLEPLVDLLRHRIEIEGAYDIREQLLIVLLIAFRARGGSSTALCLALDRWRREAPPPKPDGTNSLPNRFIGAQTLGELANMIGERDPDYQTVKAAEKLVLSTPFADVRAFAAAHPRLCEDSRLAYALTRRQQLLDPMLATC